MRKRVRQGAPSLNRLMGDIRRQYKGKILDVKIRRAGSTETAYVFTILRDNRIFRVQVPLARPARKFNFNAGRR